MTTTHDQQTIQPYLFFDGRCEEALAFYRAALGAEVTLLMRFRDSPEPAPEGLLPPGSEDRIMHAELRIGRSTVMASDGCATGPVKPQGFSLALNLASEAEADRRFHALADGGIVRMPLGKTFWSPRFGMLEDRFGIGWMINVDPATTP